MGFRAFHHPSSIVNHKFRRAFTLLEMLVVLAIMGILAGLVVPALKNFGHADAMTAADQQMLNDVARARQLAISQRTTVYMVFVPTNFWANFNLSTLTPAQLVVLTNLCGGQLTSYTFVSHGNVGDQPGQHQWHYLAPWQTLPDGTFVQLQKFAGTNTIVDAITGAQYPIAPFNYTNDMPFPTEDTVAPPPPSSFPWLPYIAFNYLGQLTDDGVDMANAPEYIPLARGSVSPAINADTRMFLITNSPAGAPQVIEVPRGNSTNAYNIIDIDPLTGRATLKEPKVQ